MSAIYLLVLLVFPLSSIVLIEASTSDAVAWLLFVTASEKENNNWNVNVKNKTKITQMSSIHLCFPNCFHLREFPTAPRLFWGTQEVNLHFDWRILRLCNLSSWRIFPGVVYYSNVKNKVRLCFWQTEMGVGVEWRSSIERRQWVNDWNNTLYRNKGM